MGTKNCPLIAVGAMANSKAGEVSIGVECMEERCGWWIEESNECAIRYLAVTEGRKL